MAASIRSTSRASRRGTSITCPTPPGVVAGDMLLLFHSTDGSLAGMGSPSGGGWQFLGEVGFTAVANARVWWKTVTGTEPAAGYTMSQNGIDGIAICTAIKGSTGAQPNITYVTGNEGTPLVSPPITPDGASNLLVRYMGAQVGDLGTLEWTPPGGHTLATSAGQSAFVSGAVASMPLSSSAAVPAGTWTAAPASAADFHISFSITIISGASPGEGPPPTPEYPPFAPGRGSGLYRYVFRRLLDGQFLGELDLAGVQFDKRILQPGAFSATIPVPNRTIGAQVAEIIPRNPAVLSTGPGVIVCDVFRAGEPWGEYWITGARPGRSRRGTPAIQLRGSTLDAYLMAVELQADLVYSETDQVDIARGLLAHLQEQAHANIGLTLQSGTTGQLRDRTYLDTDRASYGQRLRELAEVDGGFEWMINIAVVDGVIQRQWAYGYPRLGSAAVQHVFSDSRNGGDILDWAEEYDALRGATRWRSRGDAVETDASTRSVPLVSTPHEATAHLAAGWPRIDRTIYRQGVTVQQTLEDYAAYWVATAPGVLRVDQVTVALGAQPSLTPNNLGDLARFYLDNEWHDGEVRERRIIGMSVTPVSRQSGKEEADLVLEGLEVPNG